MDEIPVYDNCAAYKNDQFLRQQVRYFIFSTTEEGFVPEDVENYLLSIGVPKTILVKNSQSGQIEQVAKRVAAKSIAASSRYIVFDSSLGRWLLRSYGIALDKLRSDFVNHISLRAGNTGFRGYAISETLQKMVRTKMFADKVIVVKDLRQYAVEVGIPETIEGEAGEILLASVFVNRLLQSAKKLGLIVPTSFGTWKVM